MVEPRHARCHQGLRVQFQRQDGAEILQCFPLGGVPNRHPGEPTAELPSLRSPPQVGLQASGVLQRDASTFGFRGGLHPQRSSHLRQRPFESDDSGEPLLGSVAQAGAASVQRRHVSLHPCAAQQEVRARVQGYRLSRRPLHDLHHGNSSPSRSVASEPARLRAAISWRYHPRRQGPT
ncbi:unnamed protein product [Ectocarpus fasciculatus]